MAASSPRKPRRARGRHHKPSTFPAPDCGRWLRVGVVGTGLAAAIAAGSGVASASTDDSANSSGASSRSETAGNTDTSADTKTEPASDTTDDSADTADADDTDADDTDTDTDTDTDDETDTDDTEEDDEEATETDLDGDQQSEVPDETAADPQDVDAPGPDDNPTEESDESPADPVAQESPPPVDVPSDEPDTTEPSEPAIPPSQVEQTDPTDVTAPRAPTPDTIEPVQSEKPATGAAPVAMAAVAAAAPPAPGSDEHFWAVLQRALGRLGSWPGLPRNFTDITNFQTDHTLDAANDQLDALIWGAVPGGPARWLPDLLDIVGLFVKPALPNFTFTDTLNTIGDFVNRVVPPFRIVDSAGTFGIITPYKIMGAAVVGTATVLQDMLNGIYDPAQWAIHVIKATTGANATVSDLSDFGSLSGKVVAAQAAALLGGDGGAFDEPERALNLTLPTWTAAQVNPFTVVTYIAVVAMYKRFQEMAVLTTFTTNTTYDSWHYATPGFGLYAAGTFHAVDPDGNSVDFFGVSQGGTYISEIGGATVTINTAQGGFTYTPWFQSAAFLHRSTSENPEDRYDTVKIPVKSADGVTYTLTFKIEIVGGSNANPTAGHTVGSTDALGVVKGKVTGSDSDGDTMTYSLVGSSVNGLTGHSAYTTGGGIVTVNPTTGDFTYVSTSTAGASQSFQVRVSDGHNGSVIRTVTVPNTTTVTPANVNTTTPYVVTGTVPGSTNSPGVFTSYALGSSPSKGTVTSFNPATGAFTYTSNAGRTGANDDVVTVLATDANGRTVTLRMAVKPTVVNNAPVVVTTTTDKGSSDPSKWRLDNAGGDNRTQTTTGKITATDADGDTLTYSLVDPVTHAAVSTTTDGGTVVFNADGSYTYTITKNKSYFHAAAKVGAAAADVNDTFTVAVTDGFTGSVAYTTVTMSTFAVNSAPTFVSSSGVANLFGLKTVSGIKFTDADGDTIGTTRNPSGGGAGYFAPSGFTSGTENVQSGVGALVTFTGTYTLYVQDGYYTVNNGVVTGSYAVSTPTRSWS